MAPPSTPTPRRFLAPKRPATQTGTPKPLAGGTQQFQATPRFSLPSTPRDAAAPAPGTPAPPSAVFSRQRRESISDIIDSSPPSPPPPPSRRFHDSIEVDSLPPSSLVPSSSSSSSISRQAEDEDADPPSPKRRRLSTSLPPGRRDDVSIVSSIQDFPSERNDDDPDVPVPDAPEDPWEDLTPVGEQPPARAPPTQQQQQQPTFHPAPRFKPTDASAAAGGAAPHEPLPDVFSPRRRGEKFVPGGLAAGLRDWLMDLETATGAKRDGEWAARVFVERVRAGGGGGGASGMRLVHGRRVRDDNDNDNDDGGGGDGRLEGEGGGAGGPNDNDDNDDDASIRWTRLVLAGDGRLTGLARRNEVTVGAVLGIAKPVWEVGLGREGRWLMACDWKVL